MKKRLLSILIVLCLCLSVLSACASSGETAGFTGSAEPASDMTNAGDAAGSTEQSASDNTSGSDAGDGIAEPIIEAQYTISEVLSDFSEDRAWIKYHDNENNSFYGVIDKNGFIVYSIGANVIDGWSTEVTEFIDGFSCIFSGRGKMSEPRNKPGVIIIDKDGNTIFNSEEMEEDHYYYYMGYGDGTILLVENIANFSENKYYICELDLTGEIVFRSQLNVDELYIWDGYTYFTDDLFIGKYGWTLFGYISHYAFYNRKTHSFYATEENDDTSIFETTIDTGYIRYRNNSWSYYLPIDFLYSKEAWSSCDLRQFFVGYFGKGAEGLINDDGSGVNSAGIYDYSGQLIASYPENWNIIDLSAFSDGFAFVGLRGADNNYYATVVDTNANSQYDPIKYDDYISSGLGYVLLEIDGERRAFDPTGTEIPVDEYDRLVTYRFFDGIMHSQDNKSFVDLDGNVLIDTVYVVSNYDEVSGQIYHLQNPDSASDNTTTSSKDYITLSDFSIEGKWKNVGTYTFGQVQSGAIVAFDGINCNFFSPKDTYAFYQDGDDYKLECTSLLSTDTLTFAVKIVDENNIDVFNGSNYLELTRVE